MSSGDIALIATNKSIMPYSIKLEATLKGLESNVRLPSVSVIQASGTDTIALFKRKKNVASSFNYNTTIIEGNVNAKHDNNHIYELPYPTGKAYKIDQGYNGNSTHQGKYALDFHMDEGTEISAIRNGLVVEAIESNKKGCPEDYCAQYNNYILILHDDGTFADYSHLQKNGALVKPGEKVKAGQIIGLSGKTGIASGPHLHLEVYTMSWEGQQSIPVKYQVKGKAILPVEGMSYLKD